MTYWAKCEWDNPLEGKPWNDVILPNRGSVAFSNRVYNIGDLILIEKPLIICSGHHPFSNDQLKEIEHNVAKLSDTERLEFYKMANSVPPCNVRSYDFDPKVYDAANIFITNSFDMTDRSSGEACAIYCALGRLNHSCYPNVQVMVILHIYKNCLASNINLIYFFYY